MEPEPGVEYPVVLGPTILRKRQSEEYCSLRYDFLPASVAKVGQGHLEVHADSQVLLQLPTSSGSASLQFAGRQEVSKDGLDCVAIFDGTEFRLEVLQATIKGLRPSAARKGGAGSNLVRSQPAAAAAVLSNEAFTFNAGSPPVPPADGPATAVEEEDEDDDVEAKDGEEGFDDLEQALFEHLNEEETTGEPEHGAARRAAGREQGGASAQPQHQPPQQPTVYGSQVAPGSASHVQPSQASACTTQATAPYAAAAPVSRGAAGRPSQAPASEALQAPPPVRKVKKPKPLPQKDVRSAASTAGAAVVGPPPPAAVGLLPNPASMSELDLEFFGDMVGSPEVPVDSEGEAEGSSSDDDEVSSSSEEEGGDGTGARGGGQAEREEFI